MAFVQTRVQLAISADTGFPPPPPPSVTGTDGDDTLEGFHAGIGNIAALDGDDLVKGGAAIESISGDAGNDTLYGGARNDMLIGGLGDDRLIGGAGVDSAFYDFWDAGAAVVFDASPIDATVEVAIADGMGGVDRLRGIEGVTVGGSRFDDLVRGSAGDDWISSSFPQVVTPGSPPDSPDLSNDTIFAGAGNDYVAGGSGDDLLGGGADDDQLRSWAGNDTLWGGSGHDGAVFLFPYSGSTTGVRFSAAAIGSVSRLLIEDGLGGVDELVGIEYAVLYGTELDDTFTGSVGHDSLNGFAGADRLTGGAGRDSLWGGDGDDVLIGQDGHDSMRGDADNDRLFGGAGRDWLDGGPGNDTLRGGDGVDAFSFSTVPLALAPSVDTLADFHGGIDTLQFSAVAFAALGAAGPLAPGAFVRGTTALESDDRILYDRAGGHLLYDADGSGNGLAAPVAELEPGTVLTAADIWVV